MPPEVDYYDGAPDTGPRTFPTHADKRRFVLLPERDFRRPQKRAGQSVVRPQFVEEAMREPKAYRKTGEAASWPGVKPRLGL